MSDDDLLAEALHFETTELVQLHRHRSDYSSIGDCFRTSIACLIGAKQADLVPHFCEQNIRAGIPDDYKGGWQDIASARRWLRGEGLDLLFISRAQADEIGIAYKLTVKSHAGDWNHCVIARRGEVIWDPAGVGGYSMADDIGEPVGIITTPYEPEPDEMLRRWHAADAEANA